MKKQVVFALAVLLGSFSFAQKSEIKDAEKAIKSGNYADAKASVNAAEPMIASADEKMQAQFYFVKGQALYAGGKGSEEEINMAIESLDKAVALEKQSGKKKYSDEIQEMKVTMLNSFLTGANEALQAKKYMKSSAGFNRAYRMSPKDTLYLYYAASTAVTAQDYDTSLKYYNELRDLGYEGIESQYTAINKETNEEEDFPSKQMRDISVKAGTHISPKDTKTEPKSAEIVKNIALIYLSQGDDEKALEAMAEAREKNPDDFNLLISEANVQLKMGNKDRFKELMQEATSKDPNNPELQFNLGVLAAEAGETDQAKKYYKKAIELDPSYADAQNNMAVLILSEEAPLIEKMNALGSSAADNKKYDELKEQRTQLYMTAIPYLETTLKLKPNDVQAAKTLMQIYSATSQTEKFKEMQAKVEAMEGGN